MLLGRCIFLTGMRWYMERDMMAIDKALLTLVLQLVGSPVPGSAVLLYGAFLLSERAARASLLPSTARC